MVQKKEKVWLSLLELIVSELGSVGAGLWLVGGGGVIDHLLFLPSGHDSPFDGNPGTPNPTAGVWVSSRALHGFQQNTVSKFLGHTTSRGWLLNSAGVRTPL